MKNNIYHYKECGLDNVYLHNVNVCLDAKGEQTIVIKKINKLHKVIGQAIIEKKGLLNPKEIIFLRALIGQTQQQFGEMLGKKGQTVGRWERGEIKQDQTVDTLIRIMAKNLMRIETVLNAGELSLQNKKKQLSDDKIDIDGQGNDYVQMLKAA